MNPYSSSDDLSVTESPRYSQFIPFNFQYPDLGILIEFESYSESSSSSNRWIYLVAALTALGLSGLSFLAQSSQIQQSSYEVQQAVYANYLSLTHY